MLTFLEFCKSKKNKMINNTILIQSFAFLMIASIVVSGLMTNTTFAEVTQKSPPSMKLSDPLPANLFVELARIINPAVVNISTTSMPKRGQMRDPMLEFFEQFYGMQQPMMKRPQQQSLGTGFIIRDDGLILTNNHVVQGADIINVQLAEKDTKTYEAKLVGNDERLDIAIIKIIVDHKLPVAALGSGKDIEVGEWVAAFGNPFGHGHTMTKGIISSKGREIEELNKTPLLQTDASINPGNSGGPLVNTKGYVIGVNSAIDARAQGIGFAIPIDAVRAALPQLEENGRVKKGFLGVLLGDLDPAAAEYLGLEEKSGAVITEVQAGTPARKAGFRPYDIVVEFNGKKIKNSLDLMDAVSDAQIGKQVKAKVIRERKSITLNVDIGENADIKNAHKEAPKVYVGQKAPFNLGFSIKDIDESIRKEWRIPDEVKKPVVVEVDRGSLSSRAGIRVGDVILDVNKQEVETTADVIKSLKKETNTMRLARGSRIIVVMFETK